MAHGDGPCKPSPGVFDLYSEGIDFIVGGEKGARLWFVVASN